MKSSVLLLALVAIAFSSCTTAYKTGQTPDDVYYSPVRPQEEYVQVDKQDDRRYRGSDEDYYEDRFLRMRMHNRYRWSALDDYYFHNAYAYNAYGYYNNWHSPWNSYWAWNSYYNPYSPYCGGLPYYHYPGAGVIKNPRIYTPPSRAMVFNPNSYINSNNGNRSTGARSLNNSYNSNSPRYNNRNSSSRSSLGESVRKVFSNSNNNNYSNSTPSRTYNPPSNSSSSSSSTPSRSSSSGSSGGGSSRPPR